MAENSGKNILLIGYRGCGKSTVGRLLAAKLGRDFLDTDDLIQKHASRTIADIFDTEGEEGFRRLETEMIQKFDPAQTAVISLGGGAVEIENNRKKIEQLGYIVWLTAPPQELHRRIAADADTPSNRPPLMPTNALAEIRRKLAARTQWYESLADLCVDTTGQDPARIAKTIYEHYGGVKSR